MSQGNGTIFQLANKDASQSQIQFGVNQEGLLYFILDNNEVNLIAEINYVVQKNVWTHFTLQKDKDKFQIFVNCAKIYETDI